MGMGKGEGSERRSKEDIKEERGKKNGEMIVTCSCLLR